MVSNQMLNNIGKLLKDHSPEILSGLAVAGVIGTAVLAVRATPKACEEIAAAREDKYEELDRDPEHVVHRDETSLSMKETVLVTWKLYIPAGLSAAATIACIIGANTIGARRNAALVGAYALTERALNEYRDKVKEVIGEQKEDRIREQVAEERVKNDKNVQTIVFPGGDDVLCYELYAGRAFRCTPEKIRRAVIEVNDQITHDMYSPLNDFYVAVGLEQTPLGTQVGFNLHNRLDLKYSSQLNECDVAVFTIDFVRPPSADYDKLQ